MGRNVKEHKLHNSVFLPPPNKKESHVVRGNKTIAIINGPEKYNTLEHSFSLVINDINCETVPLGALLNFE